MRNVQINNRRIVRATLLLTLFVVCATNAAAQQRGVYQNPVVAGDYPDPSVIRVGEDYWATTTSGTWEPEFPILHSRNMVNWEVVGAVFHKRPAWAERDFWAPEISEDSGRFFVYYTARKRGGPLCVAVATSNNPSGPYTDRGPLVCQEIGSIDAMAVRDERGERYLIWKEDGNSRNQPTPLWAQKLSNDGTKLTGSKRELIRNDPKSWEGGVVEGAFVLRRGEWFYLFYSGNACCGRRCNYALGVARSRKFLGPWEKNPANPILAENKTWQCPGHGSIVRDTGGREFLLYHAYRKSEEAFYIGREALLDRVTWSNDGWPTINDGQGPSGRAPAPLDLPQQENSFFDDFASQTLNARWQWRQENAPVVSIETERGGRLSLTPPNKQAKNLLGAVLVQRSTASDYVVTTMIDVSALKRGAAAGLSAYSSDEDALGVVFVDGKVNVYRRERNQDKIVMSRAVPNASNIYLRMSVRQAWRFRFALSLDGREWQEVGEEVSGSYLEPVNIALTSGGAENAQAKFEWVRITPSKTDQK
ncbi:MAG: family 43 glycosylhydrolase [Pyrinomonadaceae bacterium]